MIRYQHVRPELEPRPRSVQLAIKRFLEHGSSSHSKMGILLVGILNHCEIEGIPYELQAHPRAGYHLKRMPDFLEPKVNNG